MAQMHLEIWIFFISKSIKKYVTIKCTLLILESLLVWFSASGLWVCCFVLCLNACTFTCVCFTVLRDVLSLRLHLILVWVHPEWSDHQRSCPGSWTCQRWHCPHLELVSDDLSLLILAVWWTVKTVERHGRKVRFKTNKDCDTL